MIDTPTLAIETSPELRRLLTELMMTACATNRVAQARQIRDGYAVIAPDAPETAIAGGLIELTAANADAAVAHLRPLAAAQDPYGMAFLALALKVAGRSAESRTVLDGLTDEAHAGAQALAAALREAQ